MGVYRCNPHTGPEGERWTVWFIDNDASSPADDDDQPGELVAEGLADVYDVCAVMAEHHDATLASEAR